MDASGSRSARLVLVGLVAGLFSAVFGVGGGIIVVPLLLWLLRYDAKAATATSLAGIIITAIAGSITHGALGNVDTKKALAIGLPAVVGVLGGLAIKDRVSSKQLTYGFAVFLVLVAVRMALPDASGAGFDDRALEMTVVVATGLVAGAIAGLFGVGGGIVFVPALILIFGLSQDVATGTSLLAMIPVSILGTWRQRASGLVHFRDATIIGLASAFTAVGGAFIVEHTRDGILRVLFSVLLVATALQLTIRARRV